MLRQIIEIDEELCNGCGDCVAACAEGAIQLIDGKARLINEIFCDGLGACVGDCPVNAITVSEKDVPAYDEKMTILNLIPKGRNTLIAHLKHLKDHGMKKYVHEALDVLHAQGIDITPADIHGQGGCPSCQTKTIETRHDADIPIAGVQNAGVQNLEPLHDENKPVIKLRQWPIQLHLLSPYAPYFENADVLLAADCVPLAYSNFHTEILGEKAFALACPKLDSNKDAYLNKLVTMITESNVRSITVAIMEVPCCSGLVQLAKQAIQISGVDLPLHILMIKISGELVNLQ